jgi:hypothetical protein
VFAGATAGTMITAASSVRVTGVSSSSKTRREFASS